MFFPSHKLVTAYAVRYCIKIIIRKLTEFLKIRNKKTYSKNFLRGNVNVNPGNFWALGCHAARIYGLVVLLDFTQGLVLETVDRDLRSATTTDNKLLKNDLS
jgi:hypothetical protein